jgi:hypothetical protein
MVAADGLFETAFQRERSATSIKFSIRPVFAQFSREAFAKRIDYGRGQCFFCADAGPHWDL